MTRMNSNDYYALLNLPRTASFDDIKAAYRRLIKLYHPDTGNADEQMVIRLNLAYETLKDPVLRANYDKQLPSGFWYVLGQNTQAFGQAIKENFTYIKQTLNKETTADCDEHLMAYVYPWQAILGDKIAVKTTCHHILVPITPFETTLKLKITGAGLPKVGGGFGDLHLTVAIKAPKFEELNREQQQAVLALKKTFE